MKRVVILGAGPAGLAAALELAEKKVPVTILEINNFVGGNATSFNIADVNVDYGSHRLHPASDPAVFKRIQDLLGDDLLERPRHGRIKLLGRWIHFPLKIVDLVLRLHPKFSIGVGIDLISGFFPFSKSKNKGNESFASVIQTGLGKTICNEFYFPYAKKIWGLDPEDISPIQAYKRVSANSIMKMIKRLLPGGSKGSGGSNKKGIFYYPRFGFGQISTALHKAAEKAGAEFVFNAKVTHLDLKDKHREVVYEIEGKTRTLSADQVYSTIPVSILTHLLSPAAPKEVLEATKNLDFRAMILAYLQLDQDQFTEFDAHYFPEEAFPFTRISEPKNYTDRNEPVGTTVLCAEIPCNQSDDLWTMDDSILGKRVADGLEAAGLPISSKISHVETVRIPYAYPLYKCGYEKPFEIIDEWVNKQQRVLTFGRQGLYVHDNTHHAIYMAQAAAKCLNDDGSINTEEWKRMRKIFESHVVED
jgi:protoporphyrinogen oxidase